MANPRSEISERVLTIVSEKTGIDRNDILSRKRLIEMVDARHLYVRMLNEHGLYAASIADMSGLSRRQVNNIITHFDSRIKFSALMRHNYEIIKHKLGSVLDIRK